LVQLLNQDALRCLWGCIEVTRDTQAEEQERIREMELRNNANNNANNV